MAALPCCFKLRMVSIDLFSSGRTRGLPHRPASFPANSSRCLCVEKDLSSWLWVSFRSSSGLKSPTTSVRRAAALTSSADCQPPVDSFRRKDLQLEDILKSMASFRALLILQSISVILVGRILYLLKLMTPKERGSMKFWCLWMVGDEQLRNLGSQSYAAALLVFMLLMIGSIISLTHLVKNMLRHLQKTRVN